MQNKPPIDEISVLTPFPGECGWKEAALSYSYLYGKNQKNISQQGIFTSLCPFIKFLENKSLPVFSFFQAQAFKVGQAIDPPMTGASSVVGAGGHESV